MDDNHKLGLYVSYYLARFDTEAYSNLGFGNQKKTHEKIGELLSVNPNTVQNWRDEFDPLFGHRAGWYQRPLSPSRVHVANSLNHLTEQEIRIVVKKILNNTEVNNLDLQLLSELVVDDSLDKERKFVLRAPTGRKAEQFFIDYSEKTKKPHNGKLIDTRDLGCGYDFKINDKKDTYYIEVKGLSQQTGGILLTNKEWETAKEKGERYYIAIVSNINENPEIAFIKNPADVLSPNENIIKTIQVNWSVSSQQLKEIL